VTTTLTTTSAPRAADLYGCDVVLFGNGWSRTVSWVEQARQRPRPDTERGGPPLACAISVVSVPWSSVMTPDVPARARTNDGSAPS
jgi:hypothetical protein